MINYGLGIAVRFFFTYFFNCLQAMRCLNRVPVYLLPLIKKQSCYMSNVWHFFLFLFIIKLIAACTCVSVGCRAATDQVGRSRRVCIYVTYSRFVESVGFNIIFIRLNRYIQWTEGKCFSNIQIAIWMIIMVQK